MPLIHFTFLTLSALMLAQGAFAGPCPTWDQPEITGRPTEMKKYRPELLFGQTINAEMHTYFTKPDGSNVNTHYHLDGTHKGKMEVHVNAGANILYMETHLDNFSKDIRLYKIPARTQCDLEFTGSDMDKIIGQPGYHLASRLRCDKVTVADTASTCIASG